MVASQNSFRNSVNNDSSSAMATAPVPTEARTRERSFIEQLLSLGSPEAAAHLAAYWRREKSPAAAHFVVNGYEKLLPQMHLVVCRLAILRSFTVEPLVPLLRAAAFSAGIHLQTRVSDYNVYVQEILDPQSRLYEFRPDAVILAVQTADVAPRLWHSWSDMTSEERAGIMDDVASRFRSWIKAFRTHCQADLIVHNLQLPSVSARGLLDAQCLDGQQDAIVEINRRLRQIAASYSGVHILDYDGLVARHGRSRWTDENKRLAMSLPIATANLIHLCDEWMRFLHPVTGKIAKAIVVDLDNTLWGGLLGEDGKMGIHAGPEYPGAIYREVQRALLDLRNRGILLAIASKNDPEEALDVLATHPDMLLRPHHFAALRIGWQEKSQSLREIALELNIGVDMLAFLDDNPVERQRIATELPEATVIELPNEPLGLAKALRDCPAFERLSLSEEDLRRGQYYKDQRQREDLQRASASPEEFFRSLQQVVEIAPLNASNARRVAQLTQKTNQFNLTSRRYTEQEIGALAGSSDVKVFAMRVKDVYNDNGIVGVAILRKQGSVCEIETFLLSCRIIGRTVETAFLSFLCDYARTSGAATLKGWFLPTKKNAPARDFYPRHGFSLVAQTESGSSYQFDLSAGVIARPEWIQVV